MRDMLEMCLVTMFLEGGVDREREDWMEIALMYVWQPFGKELNGWSLLILVRLPLFEEDSCALGVVMLHYLDELFVREDPTSNATREEMTSKGQGWVIHSDFKASQQLAFGLWDAVSGYVIKEAGIDVG